MSVLALSACTVGNGEKKLSLEEKRAGKKELLSQQPPFSVDQFLPQGATAVKQLSADFDTDGIEEQVLYYEMNENIGNEVYKNNQHLNVLRYEGDNWLSVKKDQARVDLANEDRHISSFEIFEYTSENQAELLVYTCGRRCRRGNKYYAFGFNEGEWKDLDFAKGYLNEGEYLKGTEDEMHLTSLQVQDGKIIESYDIYCSDKPYAEASFGTDAAICRNMTVVHE